MVTIAIGFYSQGLRRIVLELVKRKDQWLCVRTIRLFLGHAVQMTLRNAELTASGFTVVVSL